MGTVFRPKDSGRGDIKDFSPDTKDNVLKLLNSWEGNSSGKKLKQILRQNKSEELLRNIVEKEDVNLPEDERIGLMFSSNLWS